MKKSEKEHMSEVKSAINEHRIDIKTEKEKVDKLGEETESVCPKDLEQMYAGKLCALLIKMEVSAGNIIFGYTKKYPSIPESLKKRLEDDKEVFLERFANAKLKLGKIIEQHPLWGKMEGLRGFTSYQLGLIMAYIKYPARFPNFSQLAIYSGLAAITDPATGITYPVTKANIPHIKKIYEHLGKKEFMGFNTSLSGRMNKVVPENLIRQQGYFYNRFVQIRATLEAKAIAEGRCEKDGEGKWYMRGKKKQSLISWTQSNARRRISTLLLYFVWSEWRQLEGLPIRAPYVIEHLGHTGQITLEMVKRADASITRDMEAARAEKKNKGSQV